MALPDRGGGAPPLHACLELSSISCRRVNAIVIIWCNFTNKIFTIPPVYVSENKYPFTIINICTGSDHNSAALNSRISKSPCHTLLTNNHDSICKIVPVTLVGSKRKRLHQTFVIDKYIAFYTNLRLYVIDFFFFFFNINCLISKPNGERKWPQLIHFHSKAKPLFPVTMLYFMMTHTFI